MPEPDSAPNHDFSTVGEIAPLALIEGLRLRPVSGERITLAVFELDPGTPTPEHRHPNEQVGVVIRGEFTWVDKPQTPPSQGQWSVAPGVIPA